MAIAALHALATGTKRVAVFDFDVHHGNGTEAILLNKPGTAFFSIHQFPCYPGTGQRTWETTVSITPCRRTRPAKNIAKVLSRALEELKKFKPELIAVSAGFDAYARDPLAQETLEAEDFHWLGEQMRAWCADVQPAGRRLQQRLAGIDFRLPERHRRKVNPLGGGLRDSSPAPNR